MTDKTQQAVEALERVEKYLKRKKTSRMIDPEIIHNFDDKYDLRVSDLNTMIEALRSSQWRDISTAPRDGTEILVNLKYNVAMYIVYFEDGKWQTSGDHAWKESHIANWQPLPTPPAEKE